MLKSKNLPKSLITVLTAIFFTISLYGCKSTEGENYRAIAYVTVPASDNWRWIGSDTDDENGIVSDVDVRYITHINFAFGMLEAYQFEDGQSGRPLHEGRFVSQEAYKNPDDGRYHYKATLSGWIEEMKSNVDGGKYLSALVSLKDKKPALKILLSIGGWDSDGFCYMAKTAEGRSEFIESCIDLINSYNIDGIDLDWEYPTNGAWGEIASCDTCVEDARTLLKEFRTSLDERFPQNKKLLTIASGAGQPWVDNEAFKALDYMNVMCYDYKPGSGESQADLESSKIFMANHAEMVGDTPENRSKINLGVPFYNEGGPYLVPYYKEWSGHVDTNPEILKEKMNWVKSSGYGGCFYWAYSMDTFEQDTNDPNSPEIKILQRTVYETLNMEKTAPSPSTEKDPMLGEYKAPTYTNDHFGFTLDIPTGWQKLSQDVMDGLGELSIKQAESSSADAEYIQHLRDQVENSKYMIVALKSSQTNNSESLIFMGSYENISRLKDTVKNESEYVDFIVDILSEQGYDNIETHNENLGGEDFIVMRIVVETDGIIAYQDNYMKMYDDYILSFSFECYSEDSLEKFNELKNTITFK